MYCSRRSKTTQCVFFSSTTRLHVSVLLARVMPLKEHKKLHSGQGGEFNLLLFSGLVSVVAGLPPRDPYVLPIYHVQSWYHDRPRSIRSVSQCILKCASIVMGTDMAMKSTVFAIAWPLALAVIDRTMFETRYSVHLRLYSRPFHSKFRFFLFEIVLFMIGLSYLVESHGNRFTFMVQDELWLSLLSVATTIRVRSLVSI